MKLKILYAIAAVCASVLFWGFLVLLLTAALRSLAVGADVPPCNPVVFTFTDQAECTRLHLGLAPCSKPCGRLCWREGRREWRWMQDRDGCPRWPGPTPTPTSTACNPPACRAWGTGVCMNPCPYQTSTPAPTRTAPPATRTPSGGSPCDRGELGWELRWLPETDTVLCVRVK